MEYKILKDEKNELELEVNNLAIAELLRVELNNDENVKFAAWRREHINENPIMLIQTSGKGAKKALQDAISRVEKKLDKLAEEFKKVVK